MGMWTYEREQWKNGVQTVCGVDEAGAGPLMGMPGTYNSLCSSCSVILCNEST